MRLALTMAVVCSVSAVGCDFSRNRVTDGRFEGYNHAELNGVVKLPEGSSRGSEALCNALTIQAVAPDGTVQGRSVVHPGHGRCSYEINNLPSDVELSLKVTAGTGWSCAEGYPASLSAADGSVRLKDFESRIDDVTVACSGQAAQSSRPAAAPQG